MVPCVLLPHLLLPLAMFSRVTDLGVAPARLREADRRVYLPGFCRAATPAESNCWYSLAVSRIKNRRGLRRRKFIRSAAANKWDASFDGGFSSLFFSLLFHLVSFISISISFFSFSRSMKREVFFSSCFLSQSRDRETRTDCQPVRRNSLSFIAWQINLFNL